MLSWITKMFQIFNSQKINSPQTREIPFLEEWMLSEKRKVLDHGRNKSSSSLKEKREVQ
ncbi:hypothetical protein MLC52_06970 [Sulfurimonas sp. NW15]|uniref:hypothetical protein n=1 Tax=Sulfurimonas sp. NW15 TaxID=2922729 RepID=UPI003DA8882D